MSDEKADAGGKGGGGLSKKTVLMVAVMLVAEAGVIVGAMTMLGGPSEVQGVPLDGAGDDEASGGGTVEVPLLHERLSNTARGAAMVYDTEILLVVPVEHQAFVERQLEEKRGQIRTGVSQIWRAAKPSYFEDPGYETLSEQTRELLLGLLDGEPPEGTYIERVLIPKCMGFRNDF
jgi:hypothetical protein